MAGEGKRVNRPAAIGRYKGTWTPGKGPDRLEAAPPPERAKGDPSTLVGHDSPDDVDLYRHGGPPPGLGRSNVPTGEDGWPRDPDDQRPHEHP